MKLCVLGSGSEGNSTIVFTDTSAILVDAGFSCAELERRLRRIDFDPARLSAMLLTHEHSDHMKGAAVLSRRYDLDIYLTQGTADNCNGQLDRCGKRRVITADRSFSVGDMEVEPFPVPHDAAEPVAYMISSEGRKALILTDLGYVTTRVVEKTRMANLAVLESNHDKELLMIGPYPWYLKERISGNSGHLSNDDCEELLTHAGGNGLATVIFGHLSKTNNNPELVKVFAEMLFDGLPVNYEIASQDMPGEIHEV